MQTAHGQVVLGQLGLQAEADVGGVVGRGLGFRLGGADLVADAAPQVDLVRKLAPERDAVLDRVGVVGVLHVAHRVDLRVEVGQRALGGLARLVVAGQRGGERGVGGVQLALQPVEVAVGHHRPPATADGVVRRGGRRPGPELAIARRRRDGGRGLVGRAQVAAGERARQEAGGQYRRPSAGPPEAGRTPSKSGHRRSSPPRGALGRRSR